MMGFLILYLGLITFGCSLGYAMGYYEADGEISVLHKEAKMWQELSKSPLESAGVDQPPIIY